MSSGQKNKLKMEDPALLMLAIYLPYSWAGSPTRITTLSRRAAPEGFRKQRAKLLSGVGDVIWVPQTRGYAQKQVEKLYLVSFTSHRASNYFTRKHLPHALRFEELATICGYPHCYRFVFIPCSYLETQLSSRPAHYGK